MKLPNLRTSESGFTMVELMVSLVIGLFLMLGVFQVFISTNNSSRSVQALARVQENGRFALEYMTRHLRLAGYQGCIDLDTVSVGVLAVDSSIDVSINRLRGYRIASDGSWTPSKPSQSKELDISGSLATRSDVVYVQYASPRSLTVDCPSGGHSCTSSTSAIHTTNNDLAIDQDDLVVVTDCDNADLFRVTNDPDSLSSGNMSFAHTTSGNSTASLSTQYAAGSQVHAYRSDAFYVKDTGRNSGQGDDIFALYRYDRKERREYEVVEGIEKLIVQYGQELDSGNYRFVSATDGSLDMSQVKVIRLALLAASSEQVLQSNDSTYFNMLDVVVQPSDLTGATVTYPQDRRLRRVFTSTVQVRN